jgi:hypothetical protein
LLYRCVHAFAHSLTLPNAHTELPQMAHEVIPHRYRFSLPLTHPCLLQSPRLRVVLRCQRVSRRGMPAYLILLTRLWYCFSRQPLIRSSLPTSHLYESAKYPATGQWVFAKQVGVRVSAQGWISGSLPFDDSGSGSEPRTGVLYCQSPPVREIPREITQSR